MPSPPSQKRAHTGRDVSMILSCFWKVVIDQGRMCSPAPTHGSHLGGTRITLRPCLPPSLVHADTGRAVCSLVPEHTSSASRQPEYMHIAMEWSGMADGRSSGPCGCVFGSGPIRASVSAF